MENLKYKVLTINPTSSPINYGDPINPIFYPFDFMLLYSQPTNVNVYIKLEHFNADEINLTKLRLIKNPKGHYTKFWIRTDGPLTSPLVIYLGGDSWFETIFSQGYQLLDINNNVVNLQTDSNYNLKTSLNAETIGLISTLNSIISTINGTNVARPSTINTSQILIDNSSGSSPLSKALFSSSTPSKRATINFPIKALVNFSVVDQSTQNPIYIGNSSSQNKTFAPGDSLETYISDLSQVYVKVNTGQKIYLEVVWEV